MLGFCGTFTCTLDDKGRLSIPAKIRPGDSDSSKRKGIPAVEEAAPLEEDSEKGEASQEDLHPKEMIKEDK